MGTRKLTGLRWTVLCMVIVSLARRVRDLFNMLSISLNLYQFSLSAKTIEIDVLQFQDKDLNVIGTLEYGQFGVVCPFFYYSSVTFRREHI